MKQIGDILIEKGLITEAQLQKGLKISKDQNTRLGKALIDLGYITEPELLSTLSKQFGIPMMPPGELVVDPTLLHFITPQIAKEFSIVPVSQKGDAILFATFDPMNTAIVGRLETQLGKRIIFNLATNDQVMSAIRRNYLGNEDMLSSMRYIEDYKVDSLLDAVNPDDALLESGPVVKFVNQVLIGAVKERASDVHIERDGNDFHIRYRIDGILKTMFRPKLSLHPMITSRIKVMAKLDVSEHRIPQDGRIMFDAEGRKVDLRVAVCPCIDGENIVLRVLNTQNRALELEQIGFSQKSLEKVNRLISHNFGLILVAGQTGSGKTTTLYSILQKLNQESVKIITLEDPVEIRLPTLNQIQVNPKVDLTFASGLRSILRMDPDVILVGEIRDPETAMLATNAAMTGHLVFSTVHCGNTSEVPVRLSKMGIEPYLTANVLLGMIAQRLVRINCTHCLEEERVPDELKAKLGIDFQTYKGRGCAACAGIGYRGRTCIEEITIVDSEIRQKIVERATSQDLEAEAIKQGTVVLKESGIEKLRSHITSATELARVL
jgi:type IV pilus assembly protein PilB